MHLNQFLAQALGISRREADDIIKEERVTLNGEPALFWQKIDTDKDTVKYEGKEAKLPQEIITIILNKPTGYVTTREDTRRRRTIMDLIPKELHHLKPVGRLDLESEGLLVMTNDGDLIYKYTHPKFEKEKEYILEFKIPVTNELIDAFLNGIMLEEGLAKADKVERLGRNKIKVVLHQGFNRQLRRMSSECHNKIIRLIRTRMAEIELGDLDSGKWKKI